MTDGSFSKYLILSGVVLIALGILLPVLGKIPFLGRMPGDIYIKRENFSFYFPIVTCIVLSVLFTLIMNFINRK